MAGITVMGGGIFGLALAWELARRGARPRLIERRRIGAGASGGLVGALAPHAPENWTETKAFQLDALLMAGAFWAEVARIGGSDPGYARTGRLQPVTEAGLDRARARGAQAAELWRGQAQWRLRRVDDMTGLTPLTPTGLVIEDTLSARIHPRRALAALAAAAQAAGAEIIENASARPAPGDRVIHATGHEGLTAAGLGGGVKGQALTLRLAAPDAPQLYADGLHIVPHVDGTVAIGSTSERDFDAPDTTDAQLDAVHARAVATCAALAGAPVVERWAGVRPRAQSRSPVLGPLPDQDSAYIFNGGFKIGFALAPRLAQIMADLILDGHDAIPAAFRPLRADRS